MVEQRAENPRVKGSTPFVSTISEYSAVGSATALGAVGRWFESSYSDQIGASSKGKTRVFGAWNVGSIPAAPAKMNNYRLANVVKLGKLGMLEVL